MSLRFAPYVSMYEAPPSTGKTYCDASIPRAGVTVSGCGIPLGFCTCCCACFAWLGRVGPTTGRGGQDVAANPRKIVVCAGSPSCLYRSLSASGAERRPVATPTSRSPQLPTAIVCPCCVAKGEPSTSSPATFPLPFVALSVETVAAPPKSETFVSVARSVLQLNPVAVAESSVRKGCDAG